MRPDPTNRFFTIIVCLAAFLFVSLFVNAAMNVYIFNLEVVVNSENQDDLFDFRVLPENQDYDPENPFLDFSVQTAGGNGTYLMDLVGSYLYDDETYELTQVMPNGWQLNDANCRAVKNEIVSTSNCDGLSDEEIEEQNIECVWQDTKIETEVGANFAPIQNGISMNIPIQPGNITVKCIFNNVRKLAKTPVLFVPGILGTQVKNGNEFIWINDTMFNPLNSDDFMDVLAFYENLVSIDDNLSFFDVVRKKKVALWDHDYTDGLINEFINQGYVESENFFTFPYDWRYGVSGKYPDGKTNSDLLKEKITQIFAKTGGDKIDIIAHSMGGLVVKKYVMENDNPKINKLVYVGVPNLGSPLSAKAVLMGDNMGIFGLNPGEIKKITQNMPVIYDLMPTRAYNKNWLTVVQPKNTSGNTIKRLSFEESQSQMIKGNANAAGLSNARSLHSSEFDNFDVRQKGIDAYNIVGCKSSTLSNVEDWENKDGTHNHYQVNFYANGDDTVSFESADSLMAVDYKTFYAPLAGHGKMPSSEGIRQKIVNIIADSNLAIPAKKVISYSQLKDNSNQCKLWGISIEIHSPVDIAVADQDGNHLGLVEGGDLQNDIAGASFDIVNNHKYVYLPQGDGQHYDIDLNGTGEGVFSLIIRKIENDQVKLTRVFNDIPVATDFSGKLNVETDTPSITLDDGNVINFTSEIEDVAAFDILPPVTTALINGQAVKSFYNQDAQITLAVQDFAPDGVTPAGALLTKYSLDGAEQIDYSDLIVVTQPGEHTLTFFSKDKLDNIEDEQTIEFTIDKTPPEFKISFDPAKKDLKFYGTDNITDPENLVISDQDDKIILTDAAGNTAQINLAEKSRKHLLRAQIKELIYNGQPADISKNNLNFAWLFDRKNNLTMLLQQMKTKSGQYIIATYANGKTTIIEFKNKKATTKTFTGLKLIEFSINKGVFEWRY